MKIKTFFLFSMSCPPPPPPSPLSPLAAKVSFGCALSHVMECPLSPCWNKENCQPGLYGSVVSRNLDMLTDTAIGSLSLHVKPRLLWPPSRKSLAEVSGGSMPNCLDLQPRVNMSAKKTLGLQDLGSGVRNLSVGTPPPIGNRFGPPPSPGIWTPSQQMYEWCLTGPLEPLLRTSHALKRLFARFGCSGESVVVANLGAPGMKPVWRLMASVRVVSFGMATRVRKMLCLMNFEEGLMYPISSDGVTGTRCEWKSKEALVPLSLVRSGSRRIWTQGSGTLNSIKKVWLP